MKTIKLNKPPPPHNRPRCPQCQKPLRPYWATVEERRKGPISEWSVQVRWNGNYHGYGHFCTLRCCERFANAVIDTLNRKGKYP